MGPAGKPYLGYILVHPLEIEEKTKSGLRKLPDISGGNTQIGIVEDIGTGGIALDGSPIPIEIEPKTKILYTKEGIREVTLFGERVHFIQQENILYRFIE